MWIFTKHGFFSCTRSIEEPHKMQIRARCKGDLVNLQRRFGLSGQIMETPAADYRWRIFCRPATWVKLATELAAEVDYSNFKNSIGDDQHDKPLMRVWSAMHDFQLQKHAPADHTHGQGFFWEDHMPADDDEEEDEDEEEPCDICGPVCLCTYEERI